MKIKSTILKTLALIIALIIIISNLSFVSASTVTTADIQKSLQKYFNTKIIVKGSDSSISTFSPMGDNISISDSMIKLINENKEYTLSTYSVENDKVTFNTNFTKLYSLFGTDTSKISEEQKISYAFVLVMISIENMELEFLTASNIAKIDNSLAYTYLQQKILDKMYTSETKIENVNKKTDIVSLQINCENNILTTGTFTIELDKLAKLSNSSINPKGTTYKVYFGTLPESEKTNISEYKDFVEIKSSYKYTGKEIKPSINLGSLEKGVDYKVSYSSNKKVGKATIKVTGIGDFYKGSFKIKFKVLPKGTSISKVTKARRAFTVKWKKQKTQTTGYQIQYSTNKNFKSGKKVTITKNKTTSKKVTKLKANKKYYVRVRTYKTVNGTKYYSSWSKVKTVKTRR